MKKEPEYDNIFYGIGWVMIACFSVLAIAYLLNPTFLIDRVRPCMFREMTGLYCPGCGGTHAVFYLFRGHPIRSFIWHPIVLYVVIFGGIFMITQTLAKLTRGRFRFVLHFRMIFVYVMIAILLINWIVKDLLILVADIRLLD